MIMNKKYIYVDLYNGHSKLLSDQEFIEMQDFCFRSLEKVEGDNGLITYVGEECMIIIV